MKEQKEIWKDIPGYEGFYKVSNLGRVKSLQRRDERGNMLQERIIRSSPSGGYRYLGLYREGIKKMFKVSVLVAMGFLLHIPNGHKTVVDHIDCIKTNDLLSNLQLITQRENASKDKKGGSSELIGVSWSIQNKKWRARIWIDGKYQYLGHFNSEIDASNAYQSELKQITNATV